MDSEVIKLPKVFFDYIMSTKHDRIQNTWMYYLYNWNVLFPISSYMNGNLIFSRYLLIINLQVLKYNKGYIRLVLFAH